MIATGEINFSEADFQRLSDIVYRHCGINLHDGKQQLVKARLAKRMRDSQFDCAGDYIDFVLSDNTGNEMTLLIDILSTNLTSFFRERAHFDHLINDFLPRFTSRKGADRRIRVWSAGCSTGEEAYSIAITLLEALPDWDIKILATDISTRVLRQAMAGTYSRDKLATVDRVLMHKYFTRAAHEGSQYQVKEQVRNVVRFRHLNLMQPWPFTGPFDLIFCRNVMIYFDKPTQEKLVRRYWECLDRGGLLFTGHSESLTGISHPLRYVQPSIYVKA